MDKPSDASHISNWRSRFN